MNMKQWLADARKMAKKKPMPVLSYPASARLGISVASMTENARVQADTMLYLMLELDMPMAITSMDLALEASCFGAPVSREGVPAVSSVILESMDDVDALQVPGEEIILEKSPYLEAIRLVKAEMQTSGDVRPIIAGISGPFSLAGQLRGVTDIMMDCYDEPELLEELVQKTTEFLCVYANLLKEAGADMLLLAEPLAGVVSPNMAEQFSHPFVKKMIESVQDDSFAVIYHNCGAGVPRMLEDLAGLGAMIYHFGNVIDLSEALENMPKTVMVMGNVDPAGIVAHGSVESVRQAVDTLVQKCGSYENFWLSTGCDVPPDAPWENLVEFMK